MLWMRVVSAAILAPLVVIAVWQGGPPFVLVVALAAGLGTFEYCRLIEKAGLRPAWPVAVAGSACLAAAPAAPGAHLGALALAAIVLAPGVYSLAEGTPVERAVLDWAHTTLGAAMVGWPLAQAVALRGALDPIGGFERGALLVLVAVTCTWASDTAAYAVGRLVGRRRFFPAVSPRKTAEGAVAAVIAPSVLGLIWAGPLSWPIVFGVVVGAAAGVATITETSSSRC